MGVFVNIHTHRPTGRGIELRTAGVHPWDADRADSDGLTAQLAAAADQVQAIGEIGLDFACDANRERQLELFRRQLAYARAHDLPVVLHCVRAWAEVMHELALCEPRAVIFHGFVGSPEQAQQALRSGYYLSFGARSLASPKTLRALRATPLSQLFLETDDSDLPIEEIFAHAADALKIPIETLQEATIENYERIFCDKNG